VTATALDGLRICDLTGQLAGAGATRFLAAFGAQVIRVEDPVRRGTWDILRGAPPFKDRARGIDAGGAFNNHNVEKLGVTLNLRDERGRDLFGRLVEISDVVTENFAAGVMERLGFGYDDLRTIRPDIIYVSNSGFGATGPYSSFKSWGPIVQAQCGLTATTGLPGQPPAGIGYSYMDHQGAYFMAAAILGAVLHRGQSGEGQWIDMACIEAGALLSGPSVLDASVNGREWHMDDHGDGRLMVPHGIYPAAGNDEWVAVACRDDDDWSAMQSVVAVDWVHDPVLATVAGRAQRREELDVQLAEWTSGRSRFDVWQAFREVGVPAAAVQLPSERADDDEARTWGLWPTVTHGVLGEVRVDGIPVHLSETDWEIRNGAPLLGQHNRQVLGGLLGLDDERLAELEEEGVL
jgi:benzylsuccinate CoA-transferase BbsF subunit